MENKIIQKTQMELANDIVIGMLNDISQSDKKAAIKRAGSPYQVYALLRGKCKDLDLAIDLIQFFRQRIADRAVVLQ